MICDRCGQPFFPGEMHTVRREQRGYAAVVVGGCHVGPCPRRRRFRAARVAAGVFPRRVAA